jgi:hypothetical protein
MTQMTRKSRAARRTASALVIPALLAALMAAGPALADKKGFCPPGLAKKSPACVPPGQAKKHDDDDRDHLRRGVVIRDYDYHLIRYPDRYGLDPLRAGERYYVVNGQILRVDQDTYEVLDVIRAVSALLD